MELLAEQKTDSRVQKTFDGYNPIVLQSAESLRMAICYYFSKEYLDLEIPCANATGLTRRQVIATAFAKDTVTDEDIDAYIKHMTESSSWGSMPQIIAFAMMGKYWIRIWQMRSDRQELFVVDSVKHRDAQGPAIELLFRNSHYDLMLPKHYYDPLITAYPFLEQRVVNLDYVSIAEE